MVRAARAVVEELPVARETSIGALAAIHTSNAERGLHNLTRKMKLALPVQVRMQKLMLDEEAPLLPLSSWARFFMSKNMWHSMSGLEKPDSARCEAQWELFWQRFRGVSPNHDIFKLKTREQLKRTAAVLLHGDEGRSRKKTAIMVLSAHSVLGRGSGFHRSSVKEYAQQDLNFLGHTWGSRWLLAVLPRKMYDDERATNFQTVLEVLAADMKNLLLDGVPSLCGTMHYFAVIHVMGDWPFLQKAFAFDRSFQNAAKQPTAKNPAKGICHVCRADQDGFPWEDFESAEPRWRSSLHVHLPFPEFPPLFLLPHDRSKPMSFPGQDLFHGWHLGAGKIFMASAMALFSDEFPGRSIDARFEAMVQDFFKYCSEHNQQPFIRKLTRETLSWKNTTDYPTGGWSKGSTTVCLVRWFLHACRQRSDNIPEDSFLRVCFKAALSINLFFSKLYRQQVWIPSEAAKEISRHGFDFLKFNSLCAKRAFLANRALFLYMPNLHRLHHVFFDVWDDAHLSEYVLSPLVYSCQMEEDFIGRPSRISRRTSPKQTMQRTVQRALEAAYSQYVKDGMLIPDR